MEPCIIENAAAAWCCASLAELAIGDRCLARAPQSCATPCLRLLLPQQAVQSAHGRPHIAVAPPPVARPAPSTQAPHQQHCRAAWTTAHYREHSAEVSIGALKLVQGLPAPCGSTPVRRAVLAPDWLRPALASKTQFVEGRNCAQPCLGASPPPCTPSRHLQGAAAGLFPPSGCSSPADQAGGTVAAPSNEHL